MDAVLDQVVSLADQIYNDELTAGATHAVKRNLIDSLGCAMAASSAPPMARLRDMAMRSRTSDGATILGSNYKTWPELAVLVNGGMIRYLDYSDDYFGGNGDTGPHPSDNIAAVLATAENTEANGAQCIRAIAVAYEICCRLVDCTSLRSHGWDHPILHAIATAAAVGKLRGLTAAQLRHAVSIAAVSNVATYETRTGKVSNWKSLAGPNGSRAGLMAASLASVGITGPARPFEGRAGLNVQLGEHIDLAGERRPGEPLKIQQTFLKYYPARYSAQLAIAVALEARTKVSIGEIASVTVFQEKRSVTSRERDAAAWKPASRESADHSQPYVIAYALARGNVTPDAYTERNYRDAEILQLAGKIDFEEDPAYTASFPGTFNCRFEVELTDGRQLTVHGHNQKGHPANPMADSEVDEKFRSLVVPLLGEQRTAQVLNYAWALEEAGDLEQLWRLIDLGSGESEGRPAADPSGSGPE